MKKVGLLLILALLSFGCANPKDTNSKVLIEQPKKQVQKLKTLHLQMPNNISNLDPAFAQTIGEREVCSLLYNGLLQIDNDSLKPTQGLAEKWEVSPDGKSYVFTLFSNLKFHNGNPLTASDVKFSWERAIYLNSPGKYIFSNIAGYWEFVTGKTQDVAGIKVINDKKLQVDLVAANNAFLLSVTQPVASVVDRYQVINQAQAFGKPGNSTTPAVMPNGSGGYKLFDWINHHQLILGLNTKYHLKEHKIERLEIGLQDDVETYTNDYLQGELDSIFNVTQAEVLDTPGLKGNFTTTPLTKISFLRINPLSTNRAFSDVRVRKALMLAIDFKRIGLYLNSETIHYLPNNMSAYLSSGYITDKESTLHKTYEASQLLREAGYPGGKGLEFTLYYPDQPELKKAAQLLKGQWSARGISVHLVSVSLQALDTLKANNTALVYLDSLSLPYPALEAFYYPEFHTAFGNGISQEVDAVIADALFTQDQTEQQKKFTSLEKSLQSQYLIRPLFSYSMTMVSKPWITGLAPNKLGLLSIEKTNFAKR